MTVLFPFKKMFSENCFVVDSVGYLLLIHLSVKFVCTELMSFLHGRSFIMPATSPFSIVSCTV